MPDILSDWSFNEEPWWDMNTQSLRFGATNGINRLVFSISLATITDYFKADSSQAGALSSYTEHAEAIHSLAVHLIDSEALGDSRPLIITSDDLSRCLT